MHRDVRKLPVSPVARRAEPTVYGINQVSGQADFVHVLRLADVGGRRIGEVLAGPESDRDHDRPHWQNGPLLAHQGSAVIGPVRSGSLLHFGAGLRRIVPFQKG